MEEQMHWTDQVPITHNLFFILEDSYLGKIIEIKMVWRWYRRRQLNQQIIELSGVQRDHPFRFIHLNKTHYWMCEKIIYHSTNDIGTTDSYMKKNKIRSLPHTIHKETVSIRIKVLKAEHKTMVLEKNTGAYIITWGYGKFLK